MKKERWALYRSALYFSAVALSAAVMVWISTESAFAKSVYVAAEHHQRLFDAWNINPGGTVTKQSTYTLQYSTDPAGIAIDNDSQTLFITSEFSGGVELVDPVTLTYLGVSTGPSNLAGIDVDDVNDIVYTVRRSTNNLYIFQWDPVAKTITQIGFVALPGCYGAFGLALDELTSTLWVADTAAGKVRAYDINTWTERLADSFYPLHKPVDIAVDRQRGLVYTVSIIGGASVPGGTGSPYLSRFDTVTRVETSAHMGHAGVGVAVDEVTGYVYVTGGAYAGDNLTVWDPSTAPFTKMQDTGRIGNPAGLAIGNVSYNPLNLAKNDIVQGAGIYIGSSFTYEITIDTPPHDLTGVFLLDTMPGELDFVAASSGGVYDMASHTVTWNLGTLLANQPVPPIYLDVLVNQNAQPGGTIYNYCTIDGDQIPPTTIIDQDPNDPGDDPGTPVLEQPPVDPRSTGFWKHQCSDNGYHRVSAEELNDLFVEVTLDSGAFDECASIGCEVLEVTGKQKEMRPKAVRQLLALWLNVAADYLFLETPVELGDLSDATTVGEAIAGIEAVVCDAEATRGDLEVAKDIGDALNGGGMDMDVVPQVTEIRAQPGDRVAIPVGVVNLSPYMRSYDLRSWSDWPVSLSKTFVRNLRSGAVEVVLGELVIPDVAVSGDGTQVNLLLRDALLQPQMFRTSTISVFVPFDGGGGDKPPIWKKDQR